MPEGLPDPGKIWNDFVTNPIVGIAVNMTVIYVVLLWLGTAYWAFRDMQARSENPILPYFASALIIFFTPLLFLFAVVLYLIVRPRETLAEVYERSLAEESLLAEVERNELCPVCRERIHSDWLVCPNCRTRLHHVCPSCNRLADPAWPLCAYCGHEFQRPAAARPAAAPSSEPSRPRSGRRRSGRPRAPPTCRATGQPSPAACVTPLAAELPASPSPVPAESPPVVPPRHHPSLDRYRTLHVLSLILVIGGIVASGLIIPLNRWILDVNAPRPDAADASLLLMVIAVSGLAILVGLAMHVSRALVVREPLWEGRYRGPSVFALLVLAIIAANAASVSVANDVLAVTQGRAAIDRGRAGPAYRHPGGTPGRGGPLRSGATRAGWPPLHAGARPLALGRIRRPAGGARLDRCAAGGRHHRPPAGAGRSAAGRGRGGSRHRPGRSDRAGDRAGGGGPGGRGDLLPRHRLQRLAARVRRAAGGHRIGRPVRSDPRLDLRDPRRSSRWASPWRCSTGAPARCPPRSRCTRLSTASPWRWACWSASRSSGCPDKRAVSRR